MTYQPFRQQIKAAAIASIAEAAQLAHTAPATWPQFVPLEGVNIYQSRTWPLDKAKLPAVLLYVYRNQKTGFAGAEPQFKSTYTLVASPRVAAAEDAQGSNGAVDAALDALADAVELALLSNPLFVSLFERIANVDTVLSYDGKTLMELGDAAMAFDLEVSEVFPPIVTQVFGGVDLKVDCVNVFDPTGTYVPPFNYPVTPASPQNPRTSGPDGRVEIAAKIDLPT